MLGEISKPVPRTLREEYEALKFNITLQTKQGNFVRMAEIITQGNLEISTFGSGNCQFIGDILLGKIPGFRAIQTEVWNCAVEGKFRIVTEASRGENWQD